MEDDNLDVPEIFAERTENQFVTESTKTQLFRDCDCKECSVKLSKLPPSSYCKDNCDVDLSKSKLHPSHPKQCDVRSCILCPTQRIVRRIVPGDPGDVRNTKRRTVKLNMTFEPIKVEIEHTDKLEKQRKPNSKKCVKLRRDKKGLKHRSKNEDTSNEDQTSPIEMETIASQESSEVHEIDLDSSKQDLESLNKSPFKSASTMGLNSSTMNPFRRSSKKRRLSTNSGNDESEKSETSDYATMDNESGSTSDNEPHNSPKKLKTSTNVDATLENEPCNLIEGVPSSRKRKLSTGSTDEETTIWTDEETDAAFDFDAPEYKKERELLAAVLCVSELTMTAFYDKLLSMDSKHQLNVCKLVKSLKSGKKGVINTKSLKSGTTKLLDFLYKKLDKYSDISTKSVLPSSPCSTIVQEDSNQMVDTSVDQDDVGTVETDEGKVRATIRKELDKIRRLKEDARNADQNKLYDVNRIKMADSRKNIFANIDEIEKDMEANDLEENVTLHAEDEKLDVPLPPDEGICTDSPPGEEMRDPHWSVTCEGSENSVDSGVSLQSEIGHDRIVPSNYDEEKIRKYISEISTTPEKDSHVLPKRKTCPVNDSVFRTPSTPKKYKKIDKVLYLKVTEMSRDKFDLLKKFDNKKCYHLPDSEKHTMSEKLKLPKMASWIPVSRNRLFDVEAPMANIPYFGDQEVDKQGGLIARMEEEYNNKVQDNKTRKEEEEEKDENNADFLLLLNALLKTPLFKVNIFEEDPEIAPDSIFRKPETNNEKEFLKKYEAQRHLLYYFRAYAIEFPEEGDTDDLINRYLELICNIPFPNIDQEKVFDVINMDQDKVLNSYQALYCRRCYEYDCKLHEEDQQTTINFESPYFFSIEQNQKSLIKMETRECGDNCFLRSDLNITMSPGKSPSKSSSPRKSLSSSPRKSMRSPMVSEMMSPPSPGLPNTMKNYTRIDWNPTQEEEDEHTGMEVHQWSTYEKLFCEKLLDTYENGFCAVSRLIITKTCRQVYEKFGKGIKKRKKMINGTKKKHKKKVHIQKKKQKLQVEKVENKHSYSPCYHPGQECSKDLEDCSCFKSNNFCDKFCYCDKNCKNRFPGCSCGSICTTKHCSCYLAQRECDPDLCGKCGASDAKYIPHAESNRCKNLAIQMNMGKKLLIGKSDIDEAGWGCILGESAKKDELIAEYVGEIITTKEAEMRGELYDKRRSSYMFILNNEFMVDAGRYGGKIRFANHSDTPNCNVKIVRVLGDFRIGLYAARDLDEGVELFFNYGEHFLGHDLA